MNNERNHRFWKWVTGILGTLLVAAIISLVSTLRQTAVALERLGTRQELMGQNVSRNAQWIADWYSVLRVPERDQSQDSAIEELVRRVEIIERRAP